MGTNNRDKKWEQATETRNGNKQQGQGIGTSIRDKKQEQATETKSAATSKPEANERRLSIKGNMSVD